ncbi:MAG TPA: DUF72 domain-containing protein [Chthoniobacterales bacterium]|jgi:uncharacterized protein YecE (DUF72 family)
MDIWIGTSGFQYPEWKGTFYPETMPTSKMLPYYAERFGTTEINYSFRRIPSEKTIGGWRDATPAAFKFSLKAPQKITHFAKLRDCEETVTYFDGVIAALGEKRGAVLFQLPASFQKDATLLDDFLRGTPKSLRPAFEFRHASWFADDVYETLRKHNAALCIAESADLSTPPVATADFGYLRLRREDYTEADIQKWAEKIQSLQQRWTETFIYFKHEESGVGPKFARIMQKELGQLPSSDGEE